MGTVPLPSSCIIRTSPWFSGSSDPLRHRIRCALSPDLHQAYPPESSRPPERSSSAAEDRPSGTSVTPNVDASTSEATSKWLGWMRREGDGSLKGRRKRELHHQQRGVDRGVDQAFGVSEREEFDFGSVPQNGWYEGPPSSLSAYASPGGARAGRRGGTVAAEGVEGHQQTVGQDDVHDEHHPRQWALMQRRLTSNLGAATHFQQVHKVSSCTTCMKKHTTCHLDNKHKTTF